MCSFPVRVGSSRELTTFNAKCASPERATFTFRSIATFKLSRTVTWPGAEEERLRWGSRHMELGRAALHHAGRVHPVRQRAGGHAHRHPETNREREVQHVRGELEERVGHCQGERVLLVCGEDIDGFTAFDLTTCLKILLHCDKENTVEFA